MARLRAVALRLALAVASLAAAGAVAEVGLRLLYPYPYYGWVYIPPHEGLFRYDPLLGWSGRPLVTGRFANLDFDVEVSHDRLGYRNLDPLFVEGKTNVLVLGDSYGWGWGVEDNEVFTRRVMELELTVNLYNLSAPGYGTDQELLTLGRILETNPSSSFDAVILLLSFTDFTDVAHDVRYTYPKPLFVRGRDGLRLSNVPVPEVKAGEYDRMSRKYRRLDRGPLNSLQLYNLISFGIRDIAEDLRAAADDETQDASSAAESTRRSDAELTAMLLGHLSAMCAERGMAFHVVLLKTSKSDPDAWQWLTVAQRLEEAGIEHSVFRSRRFPSTELWYDRHLSRHGHRQLARHVLEVLVDHSEVEGRGS